MAYLKLAGFVVVLMLLSAVGFLWKANERKAEELGIVNAALAGAEATIAYKDKTAADAQAFADRLAKLRASSTRDLEGVTNERDRYRATAEKRALADPYDFGDGFEFELARLFCLLEAGGDRAARKTCDLYPREDYHPDLALTLTVTPELAERWAEECDTARDGGEEGSGFCRWAITGFTVQGGYTVLNHLERVAAYALALEDRADTLEAMLRELTSPAGNGPSAF